ncbi:hypothetical protein SAMN04487967_1693 [Natronorubrum sediminis]|uniref:Uncharacterized protein n=1 Tax=Natronorubrum sediminis TaxID=640943 RepID=A0A1H6FWT1_9EURY|nr:hypothetical protein [Natronorubrum sediminis]SEH14628.1 hypothetical protein SAMN04487967_1693 [Natronorubrum sediminis]
MTHFVPASELYHVESGTPIAHPAHQATDADVKRALEAEGDREVCTDGGTDSRDTNRWDTPCGVHHGYVFLAGACAGAAAVLSLIVVVGGV